MSKELTPMQEAIKKVDSLAMDNKTINQVVLILKELLPKEKQGFEDAFNNGVWNTITSEQYYNTKYNNQIK
jgi:hypothetical protein